MKTKNDARQLDSWSKPILTAIIGLLSGMFLAGFDAEISDNRFFLEKQVATADRVATEFSSYVVNWDRLVKLKKYVISKDRDPTKNENERFYSILEARDDAREKLYAGFDHSNLYFSQETVKLINKFRDWDRLQSTKTINQLPAFEKWTNHEVLILSEMRGEIMK